MPALLELRDPRSAPPPGDVDVVLRESLGTRDREPRIRCPRCAWRPRAHDRWTCECWHLWNTFDTRGRCPSCGKQWTMTQCLSCLAMSPHELWYEERPEGS